MTLILTADTNPGTASWQDASIIGGGSPYTYVVAPSAGASSGNVYQTFEEAYTAARTQADLGPQSVMIQLAEDVTAETGVYDFSGMSLQPVIPDIGVPPILTFPEGSTATKWFAVTGCVSIIYTGTTVPFCVDGAWFSIAESTQFMCNGSQPLFRPAVNNTTLELRGTLTGFMTGTYEVVDTEDSNFYINLYDAATIQADTVRGAGAFIAEVWSPAVTLSSTQTNSAGLSISGYSAFGNFRSADAFGSPLTAGAIPFAGPGGVAFVGLPATRYREVNSGTSSVSFATDRTIVVTGTATLTLPAANTSRSFTVGEGTVLTNSSLSPVITIVCTNPSVVVTVNTSGGDTFDSTSTTTMTLRGGGVTTLVPNATNTWRTSTLVEGAVTYTSGPQTLTPWTTTVGVDATGGAWQLNLPTLASSRGRTFRVKYNSNSGNAVTIAPQAGETIDGGASIPVVGTPTRQAVVLYAPPTGADWWVMSTRP